MASSCSLLVHRLQHANLASLLEMKRKSWIVLGDLSVTNLFPVLKRLMGSLVGMAQYSSSPCVAMLARSEPP